MPEVEVTVCVVSPTVLTETESSGEVAPARTAGEANADMATAAMAATVVRRGIEMRRGEEGTAERNHGRSSGRVQPFDAGIRLIPGPGWRFADRPDYLLGRSPSTIRSSRSLEAFGTVAPVSHRRIEAMPKPDVAASCSWVMPSFLRARMICSGLRTPSAAHTAAC